MEEKTKPSPKKGTGCFVENRGSAPGLLVPKLCLGTAIAGNSVSWLLKRYRETEFPGGQFPNRVWEPGPPGPLQSRRVPLKPERDSPLFLKRRRRATMSELSLWVDEIADEFEAAWKVGQRPSITDYV